jgi:hypothetical protein
MKPPPKAPPGPKVAKAENADEDGGRKAEGPPDKGGKDKEGDETKTERKVRTEKSR